jgi:uncharacterized protein
LRHLCSAVLPSKLDYFRYDWKRTGLWNRLFVVRILAGGFLTSHWGGSQNILRTGAREIFSWSALLTLKRFDSVVLGEVLVGFGTAYPRGCPSGRAISGLEDLQVQSLVAVVGFFAGGLIATHFTLRLCLSKACPSNLQPSHQPQGRRQAGIGLLADLLLGIGFGIVLTKSKFLSWFRIQGMFRFQSPRMYEISRGPLRSQPLRSHSSRKLL